MIRSHTLGDKGLVMAETPGDFQRQTLQPFFIETSAVLRTTPVLA